MSIIKVGSKVKVIKLNPQELLRVSLQVGDIGTVIYEDFAHVLVEFPNLKDGHSGYFHSPNSEDKRNRWYIVREDLEVI